MSNIIGKMIKAKSYASPKYSDRPADVLCNNSGMSGDEGFWQLHSDELDCMWISVKNPSADAYLEFDLGRPEAVSYMYVWNFNQPEATFAGMREVRIFTSCDKVNWDELISPQSPFIFARSQGKSSFTATNLNDGCNSPICFNGLTARFVRIQALEGVGVGSWGGYIEEQYRHGLSAVRFFAYKPQTKFGTFLPALSYCPDSQTAEKNSLMNISNGWGLSDPDSSKALLTNNFKTMWLSKICPLSGEIIFDLEGTYPIDKMYVWNYNEPNNTAAGLKNVKIFYSIEFSNWKELKGPGYPYIFKQAKGIDGIRATNLDGKDSEPIIFGNARARYVKIVLSGSFGEGTWGTYNGFERRYGLGKVRFFIGKGYCTEPDYSFTSLISNYNGWNGADGIFMAPSDGVEKQLSGNEAANRKTIVVFSDTFFGKVNSITRQRSKYVVLNNSSAEFYGNNPQSLEFKIRTTINGEPDSIIPNPEDKKYFYWLQDGFVQGNRYIGFTDNVIFDENGMEGFQFDLIGVDMVIIPLENSSLDFNNITTKPTTLFTETPKSYYGCSVLPNTYEAQMPFADGYVYIYGLKDNGLLTKSLLVSRVEPENIEKFSKYTFYNGTKFVSGIENAAIICEEGGAEMSITPITTGEFYGKYLFIYSDSNVGGKISCRIGETPVGPFSEKILLYEIRESENISKFGGKKIYTYNAKAHYHISSDDSLLISYNVNTQDFESHIKNAEIYRPRFIRLKTIL